MGGGGGREEEDLSLSYPGQRLDIPIDNFISSSIDIPD
jgi:hypothetical protein